MATIGDAAVGDEIGVGLLVAGLGGAAEAVGLTRGVTGVAVGDDVAATTGCGVGVGTGRGVGCGA